MKKILLGVFTIAAMLTQAQIKEGTVTFKVNFEGIPPEQASYVAGTEMKLYFKDKKLRSEFTNSFTNNITVYDGNSSTTLIEGMGMKQYYQMKKEQIEKESKKTPDSKITYTEEKKTIAGYECKKAIIESKSEKGETSKVDVWYSDKLQGPTGNTGSRMIDQFKGLKGGPLEFTLQRGGAKMQMIATNVSTTPLADSKFVESTEGYTEVSLEDLKKMQGGGK